MCSSPCKSNGAEVIKRLLQGLVISFSVVILPTAGNVRVLSGPSLWILFAFGILASALQPGYNPFTIGARAGDRGTGSQIIWSVYVVQLTAVLECVYLRYPQSVGWDWVAMAALVAMVLGLALRTWAVLTLGAFFTMHLSIHEEHSVVQTGPYRICRHPSYLGAFVMYVASAVFLHAWIAALAGLVILPLAFLRRIRWEEALLKDALGAPYELYCTRVKRFLPGIW